MSFTAIYLPPFCEVLCYLCTDKSFVQDKSLQQDIMSQWSFSEQICRRVYVHPFSFHTPFSTLYHFKAFVHLLLLYSLYNCNLAGHGPFLSCLRYLFFFNLCLICLKDSYRSTGVDVWKSEFVQGHRSIALACVDRRLIAQRLCSDRITKVTEAKGGEKI